MVTAPLDISACQQTLARRAEARRAANRRRWEQAQADASRLIAHLSCHYQPDRIWVWGSLLKPEQFGPRSDIDFALEGTFTAETWFRLLGEAMNLTTFSLDIVDLGRIEPEFAAIIRMKGKVVYERNPTPV
jgi:predicted nucleotidyltransferase